MKSGIQNKNLVNFYKENAPIFQKDQRNLTHLLEKNNVKYGPWTLSFEMAPAVLDKSDLELIKSAVENTVRGAELLTNLIIKSPEKWREHFDWNDDFFELALVDPGYSFNIPCSRFDIFYSNGFLKFVELNTDGCSGMTNADLFHKCYTGIINKQPELGLENFEPIYVVPHLIDTLLSCYGEFISNFPESNLPKQPVIGILDLAGEDTSWEFEAVANFLEKMGIKTKIITPEQAEFNGERLTFAGEEIHLIYRRLLGTDYADKMELLSPVTEAFKKRKVCMVGAPRSQFPFSKKFFAFLQDDKIQNNFDEKICAAINKFIPWTRIFRESNTQFNNRKIDLVNYVRNNRDLFVLKPCESKCGYGIFQGKFMEQTDWNDSIITALKKDYIVQEFINLPNEYFPRLLPNKKTELRYIHLGGYSFGGKFSGLLGRTCANPLLTVIHGERLLPVLCATDAIQ